MVNEMGNMLTYQKMIPAAYSLVARSFVILLGTNISGPCSASMPMETQARLMRLTRIGEAPVAAARSSLDLGEPPFSTAVSKIFKSTAIRAATVLVG